MREFLEGLAEDLREAKEEGVALIGGKYIDYTGQYCVVGWLAQRQGFPFEEYDEYLDYANSETITSGEPVILDMLELLTEAYDGDYPRTFHHVLLQLQNANDSEYEGSSKDPSRERTAAVVEAIEEFLEEELPLRVPSRRFREGDLVRLNEGGRVLKIGSTVFSPARCRSVRHLIWPETNHIIDVVEYSESLLEVPQSEYPEQD